MSDGGEEYGRVAIKRAKSRQGLHRMDTVIGTFAMSILVGIVGTFTENAGA